MLTNDFDFAMCNQILNDFDLKSFLSKNNFNLKLFSYTAASTVRKNKVIIPVFALPVLFKLPVLFLLSALVNGVLSSSKLQANTNHFVTVIANTKIQERKIVTNYKCTSYIE